MTALATPLDWAARFTELAANARDPRLQAFYQAGCVTADTPLEQVPLLALDVETTGLDANQHAIVSLGLLPSACNASAAAPRATGWSNRPAN